MRASRRLLILLGLLFVGVAWLGSRWLRRPPMPPAMPMAFHEGEDIDARLRWEWMRLRNPATDRIPEDIRARELAFAATLPVRPPFAGKQGPLSAWEHRGPYNLGGRTRALALDVTDENIILAGGVSGGMWRSEDGGQTWVKTTRPDQIHSVTTVVQDPRPGKTHIWYFGTGEYRGNSASGGGAFFLGDGIYKSTDGGRSWAPLASTVSGTPESFESFFDIVWRLAVDPSNLAEDEVYAATYGGIFRSTDGGETWTAVLISQGSPWSPYTDVAVTSTGIVYAALSSEGERGGIWRSVDGLNWVNITPADWPANYQRIVLGIVPSNENTVYVLAYTPGSGVNDHSFWKYTYLSADGSGDGGRWENLSHLLPNEGGLTGSINTQGGYDMVVAVKPDDERTIILGDINLYRLQMGDTDTTLTRIGGYKHKDTYQRYLLHHPDQHAVAFYPSNPNRMLSAHDGGITRTNNVLSSSVTWFWLNNGYLTTQFYTICLDPGTPDDPVLVGGMQDNGTWGTFVDSGTAAWRELLSGDGSFCAISSGKTYYYVSSQNGTTYRLELDDQLNMTSWTRIDPANASGQLFINPFVLDPNNPQRMYYPAGASLWRNDSLQATPDFSNAPEAERWTRIDMYPGKTISAIAVSDNPPNRVYYGTADGTLIRLDDAHTDSPVRVDITSADFPQGAYVSSIAVEPGNGDHVLVAFSNYEVLSIWYSEDGGTTWTAVSGNLEENPDGSGSGPSVRWVDILPLDNRTLYFAATSTGLYMTEALEGMATVWTQEGATTIGNVVVDMVRSRQADGLVVAATHGNGVYVARALTTATEPIAAPGERFQLQAPYPNPFRQTTRLVYTLDRPVEVTLEVVDLQGRRVATLVRQYQPAGTYRVTWNGRDALGHPVASGVYLLRLRAGRQVATRPVVLMR